MGERAQKVVIRNGRMARYYTQWGGQHCFDCLLDGEHGLDEDLAASEEWGWVIPEFAEGGYLVDFDARQILLYSWDKNYVDETCPKIESCWPNWVVRSVREGVPDFESYVRERGLQGDV